MKVVRFSTMGSQYYGILEKNGWVSVLNGPPYMHLERTGDRLLLQDVELIAPCEPTKIIGIGLNYRDHAKELGMSLPEEPMLFHKPDTAVIGPGQGIVYPEMSGRVDFEAELAIVIGKPTKRVTREKASEVIFGYTCFNDVTARDLQFKDVQFTRAKGFDTFAPIGPWIVTDLNPIGVEIESYLNGERKQHSNTDQLIFDPYDLVHFVSQVMTLKPGDIIASGTPAGVGQVHPGDIIEIRVGGIGSLRNYIADGRDRL